MSGLDLGLAVAQSRGSSLRMKSERVHHAAGVDQLAARRRYRMSHHEEQMLALHCWLAMLLFIPVTAVPVSARRKGH